MNWSKVDEALEQASVPYHEDRQEFEREMQRRRWAFPGAVLLVGRGGEVVYHKAFGSRSILPAASQMTEDTVFDVASLTKALVTTTLAMQLFDGGQLSFDQRLSRVLQTFTTHGKERMTVGHLLTHSSGYPAVIPFYKQIAKANNGERAGIMTSRGAVEMIYSEIFRWKLDNVPGKVAKYSDVGFILLGDVIETLSGGQYFDKLALKRIFVPLQLKSFGFIDLSKIKRRGLEPVTSIIAPTVNCSWRGRVLCGEVHDENAWAMGGIAPHAGIFSTATDVHTVATELIQCYHGRGSLVGKDTVRKFWTVDGSVPGSTWAYGWDTPSGQGSMAGKHFSAKAVGHLGFTGCSVWIDPERELDVILLTNRIHPSIDNNHIREFRPLIHDLVMETLGYA